VGGIGPKRTPPLAGRTVLRRKECQRVSAGAASAAAAADAGSEVKALEFVQAAHVGFSVNVFVLVGVGDHAGPLGGVMALRCGSSQSGLMVSSAAEEAVLRLFGALPGDELGAGGGWR
jgi:hypothetical protein